MDIFNLTIDEAHSYLIQQGCEDILNAGLNEEISPKWDDLVRLYKLVRDRKPFQILEFGTGFSTVVMAQALKQNWSDYIEGKGTNPGKANMPYPQPQIVSLESTEKWLKNTIQKVSSAGLLEFSEISISSVRITEHQGQLCHVYENLPDIVPDFVYLDGPDPATVQGSINGLSFKNANRTVMSADILKYESTLLPGFFMIVDGRSNNARFLRRMLTREYATQYYESADVTTFELTEPRLGIKNVYGRVAYSGKM